MSAAEGEVRGVGRLFPYVSFIAMCSAKMCIFFEPVWFESFKNVYGFTETGVGSTDQVLKWV